MESLEGYAEYAKEERRTADRRNPCLQPRPSVQLGKRCPVPRTQGVASPPAGRFGATVARPDTAQ